MSNLIKELFKLPIKQKTSKFFASKIKFNQTSDKIKKNLRISTGPWTRTKQHQNTTPYTNASRLRKIGKCRTIFPRQPKNPSFTNDPNRCLMARSMRNFVLRRIRKYFSHRLRKLCANTHVGIPHQSATITCVASVVEISQKLPLPPRMQTFHHSNWEGHIMQSHSSGNCSSYITTKNCKHTERQTLLSQARVRDAFKIAQRNNFSLFTF